MAKKDNTPKGDNLESIITVQKQEIAVLSATSTSLSIKNTELLKKNEELEASLKTLSNKVSLYRGSLYTITMKINEFYWCVPSLKKGIKNIISKTNL